MNGNLVAKTPTHPTGHQLPVAVTSKFLVPGGIEWLVFGDQLDRENFRTRPKAVLDSVTVSDIIIRLALRWKYGCMENQSL